MARDLLADGRAEDVQQMIAPLLDPLSETGDAPSQVVLHALQARIHVAHGDAIQAALEALEPLESAEARASLSDRIRAEVLLWLGWAHARRDSTLDEEARALTLLDEAHRLFEAEHDAHGQCWAHLGRAHAYFAIDEYQLMRESLDEAEPSLESIDDVAATGWFHELRIAGCRFNGRYETAQEHIDALQRQAQSRSDRALEGRTTAYQAALHLDLGRSLDTIIETAERAQQLLRTSDSSARYPYLAAYHAHIQALLLQGSWAAAESHIDTALDAVGDHASACAHIQTLRARLALCRNKLRTAQSITEALFDRADQLPHGLQRSHVALLRGELLHRRGATEEAQAWMERAYRNARETGHRGNQLQALLTLADAALDREDVQSTRTHLDTIAEYDTHVCVLPFAARRFWIRGREAHQTNRLGEARSHLNQALSAYSVMGAVLQQARVQVQLAHPDLAVGAAEARSLLHTAQATFEQLGLSAEAEAVAAQRRSWPAADASDASAPEHTLGASLARAATSVRLVGETWMRAVERLLPNQWVGLYRRTGDDTWTEIHHHGTPPDPPPHPDPDATDPDDIRWVAIHPQTTAPFCMGIAIANDDAEAWAAAEARLRPWIPVLELALDRAALRSPHSPASPEDDPLDRLIRVSPALQRLTERVRRIRSSHSPVLITGERGAGKTTLAQAIHATSERRHAPWIPLNCASIPPDPLGRRLFGSADAPDDNPGLLLNASGGTVVLQEIAELPPSLQRKLWRVLDRGEIATPDGSGTRSVDVRILATSSQDLDPLVRTGAFREDLYYRLKVISLHVPPLRERREDIPPLARHFARMFAPPGAPVATITKDAMDALLRYEWPGNVRQLRNEMERAVSLVSSEPAPTINTAALSSPITNAPAQPNRIAAPAASDDILHPDCSLDDLLARTETSIIERVLAEYDGQVTASAQELGLTRQGLYKKMKRLNIDAADFHPDSSSEPAGAPA